VANKYKKTSNPWAVTLSWHLAKLSRGGCPRDFLENDQGWFGYVKIETGSRMPIWRPFVYRNRK